MSESVSLFCLVNGDPADEVFGVEIKRGKMVSDLKRLIQDAKKPALDHLPADDFDLWKVSIPVQNKEELRHLVFEDSATLDSARKVGRYFQDDPLERRVHIIVRPCCKVRPKRGEDATRSPAGRSTRFESGVLCRTNGTIAGPSHAGGYVRLELFDWDSFQTQEYLGWSRRGKVFKATLRQETVALKICDLWKHPAHLKDLINEIEVYHALEDLQGSCIPNFKAAGYTAGGLFAIATDIAGRPLKKAGSLSDEERQAIQTALECIHCQGFVHGDLHEDNILIERDGHRFRVSFINFVFSKRGCRHDFLGEMRSLEMLLI